MSRKTKKFLLFYWVRNRILQIKMGWVRVQYWA